MICNGTTPGVLGQAARGERVGTWFSPRPTSNSPYKRWLRDAKASLGSVFVDGGAAEKLRDGGASLLAVGVQRVEGRFDAGDAVTVRALKDDALIGKGISNFSSRELQQVKGMRSEEVARLLEGADEEVIHRDRFVLL